MTIPCLRAVERDLRSHYGGAFLQAENADLIGLAVSHEDIAVGRYPDDTRALHSRSYKFH